MQASSMSISRVATAAASTKAAPALFDQLSKALSGPEGEELVKKIKVRARAARHSAVLQQA